MEEDPVAFLHRLAELRNDTGKRPLRIIRPEAIALPPDDEDDSDFEMASRTTSSSESSLDSGASTSGSESEGNDSDTTNDGQEKRNCLQSQRLSDVIASDEQSKGLVGAKLTPRDHIDPPLICQVCLGSLCDSADIVQCSTCGVCAHSHCYNGDGHSNKSESTGWLCDPCSLGETSPICELCPSRGGLFQGTSSRKITKQVGWVHVLCAVYYSSASNASDFGRHPCKLCVDRRACRTGYTVQCEAGLCRERFHATCAQRAGLAVCCSSNSSSSVVECWANGGLPLRKNGLIPASSQPPSFLVNCEKHSEKTGVAERALAARAVWDFNDSNVRKRTAITSSGCSDQSLDKIGGVLSSTRPSFTTDLFLEKQQKRRALHSSPYFVGKLLQRRSNSNAKRHEHGHSHLPVYAIPYSEGDVPSTSGLAEPLVRWDRRLTRSELTGKHKVPLAFTTVFAQYSEGRAELIQRLRQRLSVLRGLATDAEAAHVVELKNLSAAQLEHSRVRSLLLEGHQTAKHCASAVGKIVPAKHAAAVAYVGVLANVPETVACAPEVVESLHAPANALAGSGQSGRSISKECVECGSLADPHLLLQCDVCREWRHLNCLDPPLTRMPKRSSRLGWQCSACPEIDWSEPRATKRGRANNKRLHEDCVT